jgi:hypothetical protein
MIPLSVATAIIGYIFGFTAGFAWGKGWLSLRKRPDLDKSK